MFACLKSEATKHLLFLCYSPIVIHSLEFYSQNVECAKLCVCFTALSVFAFEYNEHINVSISVKMTNKQTHDHTTYNTNMDQTIQKQMSIFFNVFKKTKQQKTKSTLACVWFDPYLCCTSCDHVFVFLNVCDKAVVEVVVVVCLFVCFLHIKVTDPLFMHTSTFYITFYSSLKPYAQLSPKS